MPRFAAFRHSLILPLNTLRGGSVAGSSEPSNGWCRRVLKEQELAVRDTGGDSLGMCSNHPWKHTINQHLLCRSLAFEQQHLPCIIHLE